MEINWAAWLPFLVALPGALTGIALLGWQIRRYRAEIAEKEATTAERFVNAASKLVDRATLTVTTLDHRIKNLESHVAAVDTSLNEAHNNLKMLLSVIEWLLSGVKVLSYQVQSDGNEPVFALDEDRLEMVNVIKQFVRQ